MDYRSSKRRKTPLACENCRRQKIKCDGDRPVCGNCSRRSRSAGDCVWKHVDGRPETEPGQPSLDILRALEERVRHLERQDRRSPSDSSSLRPGSRPLPPSSRDHDHGHDRSQSRDPLPGGPGSGPADIFISTAPRSEGFMGSASAMSIVNMVREAVDPSSSHAPPATPGASAQSVSSSAVSGTSSRRVQTLPSRRAAEKLAAVYWAYIHPLYPFLYRPHFQAIMSGLWEGEPPSGPGSPVSASTETNNACLVNLVLALACQYHDAAEHDGDRDDGPRSGAALFDRARSLFSHDYVASTSDHGLQVIQIMLLTAQYLNSTGSPLKSWEVTGLAIRICYGLGLHRATEVAAKALEDPVQAEMIKRVWHGCLMMERMLCTTLGRPVMTVSPGTDQTPLPSELDEELFQSGPRPGLVAPLLHDPCSTMSFFVQSAKLFEIVQQTLQAFYSDDILGGAARGPIEDFTGYAQVFDIDAQLSRWLARIPSHLQLEQLGGTSADDAQGNRRTLGRQAVVLRIRFLLARIYLFKPVLSRTCMAVRSSHLQSVGETAASPFAYANAPQVESLGRRTAFQCSLLCVQTAIEMIHTIGIHQTTAAAWGLKPSWLYGALHVYLSATVLLAARLAPAVLMGEISHDRIQDAWHRALDILGRFQADNVSANRCVAALVVLYRKLPEGTPMNGQHATGSRDATDMGAAEQSLAEGVSDTLGPGSWGLPPEISDLGFDEDLNMEWMPDLQITDPYDMTWFQATAPDFGLTLD